MLRKVIGVLASVLLVGSFAGGSALASHGGDKPPTSGHEDIPDNKAEFLPTPEGECVVTGTVHVDDQNGNGGVEAEAGNHNHYEFLDSLIQCESTPGSVIDDTFEVIADGGTDGIGVDSNGNVIHGENDAIGWSNSSDYGTGQIAAWDSGAAANCDTGTKAGDDTNKGEIWVEGQASGKQASGWVKFIREGLVVEAWGCLSLHNGKGEILFEAELEFTPDQNQVGDKVKDAELNGVATVGFQ